MIGVHRRRRIDLQSVVILTCILEQAVHRVEYFVRQIEEPLSERKHEQLHDTQPPCQVTTLWNGILCLSVHPVQVQSKAVELCLYRTFLVVFQDFVGPLVVFSMTFQDHRHVEVLVFFKHGKRYPCGTLLRIC